MSTPLVDVQQQASQLGAAVAATIPAGTADNLLIGSWNLRMFGNLSRTWQATSTDSPKRDWRAVTFIAEVISRLDVIALQEVHRNTTALTFLLEQLGQHWHVIASDAAEGDAGKNDERLAFVYNSRRVQPSGLVGEIVLPPIADTPVR
ncbi:MULTISPECIES: hypothetical protein [unclassified Nocardia]|uniref:hypothetical protein n=1 Tax=Nocardia sp. NPDC051900 TaxID=3364326 RepID=UPI0037996A3F